MWEGHNRTPVALINFISKPIIIIILIEPLCNYAFLFWAKNKVTTPGLTVKTSLFSWVVVSFFPLINNQSKPRDRQPIFSCPRLGYRTYLGSVVHLPHQHSDSAFCWIGIQLQDFFLWPLPAIIYLLIAWRGVRGVVLRCNYLTPP